MPKSKINVNVVKEHPVTGDPLRDGIFSRCVFLPTEDPDQYYALAKSYEDHFQPANPVESFLVREMIHCEWTILRLRRVETGLLHLSMSETICRERKYPLAHLHVPVPPDYWDHEGHLLAKAWTHDREHFLGTARVHAQLARSYYKALETLIKLRKESLRQPKLRNEPKPVTRASGENEPTVVPIATGQNEPTVVPIAVGQNEPNPARAANGQNEPNPPREAIGQNEANS